MGTNRRFYIVLFVDIFVKVGEKIEMRFDLIDLIVFQEEISHRMY